MGLPEGKSVMPEPKTHHGIDFARQYVTGPGRMNFNVGTAIGRLTSLADDAAKIGKDLKAAEHLIEPSSNPYQHAGDYDIFSYYSVGIVTCLEWHARSRLTDLFTYDPSCLTSDDLKPMANASLMSQMIVNNISAAQLVAGMTNISTAPKYLSVFSRIYAVLGITDVAEQIVHRELSVLPLQQGSEIQSGMERLNELFAYRNDLVHEIGFGVVGGYMLRNALTSDTAHNWCQLALRCIHALEAPITANAGKQFPNLLDSDGNSTTEMERLDNRILVLSKPSPKW
jgi:hypothetical protein